MRLGVVDLLVPRFDVPLAPGRDDLHIRRKVLHRQLKADLVVALARAAVRDGVRALLERDLRQALCDAGPRVARTEQIALVLRARLQRRDDKIVHVFVREVLEIEL